MANSLSASLMQRLPLDSGRSGNVNYNCQFPHSVSCLMVLLTNPKKPKGIPMRPSAIKSQGKPVVDRIVRRNVLPTINTHCHPFRPPEHSIVLCIAVIMRPANILPTCPTAVKIVALLAISEGVLIPSVSCYTGTVSRGTTEDTKLTTTIQGHTWSRYTDWLP